ncbi:hypothetical protein HDU85_003812 [Gaertneriomyces sp. JEL0708]|nr:hypothetical protein HDU85_003812 [Gaertneriomyces sp. JEL0708]
MIKLCVKSPNFPDKTFEVEVAPEWSISRVKLFLRELVPGNRDELDIRLIHAGKLLNDEAVVRESFATGTPSVVHMVMRGGSEQRSSTSSVPARSVEEHSHEAQTVTTSSSQTQQAPPQAQSAGLQAESPPSSSPLSQPPRVSDIPNTPPAAPVQQAISLAFPYQVVFINGLPYAFQTPVLPHAHHGLLQPVSPPAIPNANPLYPHNVPYLAGPATGLPQAPTVPAPEVPAAGAPRNRAEAQQPVGAAAVANIDDEFGDRRPERPHNPIWLLLKLTFLVYIFSHNSSIEKVIFMNIAAVVIFLIQTGALRGVNGWFPAPMPRNLQEPDHEPPGSQAAASAGQQTAPGRRSWVKDVKDVMFMFFASLIPEERAAV